MAALALSLPAWVYKRDGRLVPFDADRITLALFDASAEAGPGNAFLARELTEGVLYFLAEETAGSIPTTAQIADLVTKVVRELGHPALARAFIEERARPARAHQRRLVPEGGLRFSAKEAPAAVVRQCLTAYSLGGIFSRDLQAAQEEGLITLHGLTAPLEMLACVLAPAPEPSRDVALGLLRALDEARSMAGGLAALDGPEWQLAVAEPAGDAVALFCEQLRLGARATGLHVLLNLGATTAPPWAADAAEGPLFPRADAAATLGRRRAAAEMILDRCLHDETLAGHMTVDRHLHEADFAQERRGQPGAGLMRLARAALERPALAFSFDRPRRPHYLGPGLDRSHPTTLLAVSLHLPQLLQLPGVGADPDLFLKKTASLAGMAVSAGVQKRSFVRDRNRGADGTLLAVNRRFLLARARLVVVPVGLEAVVRRLTGRGLCEGPAPLQFAQRVLRTLTEVLDVHGRRANLAACLSGGPELALAAPDGGADAATLAESAEGLTASDAGAPLLEQVRTAGMLHAFGERATGALLLPADRPVGPEELAELLRHAWRETAVQRLVLRRVGRQQLTLPGL